MIKKKIKRFIKITFFSRCIDNESMLSCVKPKVLAYLSQAAKQDRLAITEDLALVKSRDLAEDNNNEDYYPAQYESVDPARKELLRSLMLEKLDAYLSSHQLEAKLPEAVVGSNIVPRSLVDSMPRSLTVPLSDSSDNGQGEQRFRLDFINPIMYKIVKQFFLYDFILPYRNDRSWLREEGDDTVPAGSEVQGHRFGPPSPHPDRPENVESPHLGPPLVGAQRRNDDLQADEAQGRLRGRALRTPARRASASLGDLGPRALQGVQEID